MAVGVVDLLEAVEVADRQGKAAAVAARALDLGVELAHEGAAVEQAGERIAVGLPAQLLDVAGGDHGHHRLVGEDAQRLQARGARQETVGGVVRPDAPDDLARLVVERYHEPVVVPRGRPTSVHRRGERRAVRGARERGDLRDKEAALDLEGGVQHSADLLDRDAPVGRHRQTRPPGDRARAQQPGVGVDEVDRHLLEVQRARDAVADLLQHLVDRVVARKARGDLQQLLERGAVARGLDRLLGALQRARGQRDDRDEQVELVVGRAQAGDRLADRDDAEQVAVGVPARHEQLVAGHPGVATARPRHSGT